MAEALAAQDTRPQISITANHEQFIPGEAIVFDVTIALPEPVQDMQVKGFYPDTETEVALMQVAPLTYRYQTIAAPPEGARKLRVTVYGRKKPNGPITSIAHEDKLVFVREASADLTDSRIKLTALSDAPDPFSAAVSGQNTITSAYQVQTAGAATYIIRQHVLIKSAQGDVVRDVETTLALPAGATAAEVIAHWDGKADSGQPMADGLYAYEVSGILHSRKETPGNVIEQIVGVTSAQQGEITLDNTPPALSAAQDPAANANGWNNTDVTVTFSAQDNLSGIAEVTEPVTVSDEGKDIEVNGKAVDKAGNEATLTYKVSIDKTAPDLSATQDPAPNAAGWNNTDVTVTFSAEDNLSGIAELTAPVTVGDEGEDVEVPGSATDKAGNTSYAMPTVSIDKTAPATAVSQTPGPNQHGWNNTDVKLTLTPSDALSGVATTWAKLDDAELQETTELTVSDEGEHTVLFWSVDEAGNSESPKTANVNIDKTPPKTIPLASVTVEAPGYIQDEKIVTEESSVRFRAPVDSDVVQALAFADNPALTVSAVLESVRVDVSGMQAQQDYVVTVRLIDKADNKSDSPLPVRNIAQVGPVDTDGDGIPDEVEIAEGLDPFDPSDANEDADGDCLTNLQEYAETHTDINNPDSDGDGMTDGCDETANGLDPLDPTGDNGPDGDLDGDGDRNIFEIEIGTQVDDAGSGLAGGGGRIFMSYVWRMELGKTTRQINVVPPGGGGTAPIGEDQEFLDLPEPLRMTDQTLGASFTAYVKGEVVNGFVPQPGQSVEFQGFKECTFFSQPCLWAVYGSIHEENGVAKVTGEAYAGFLFLDWHSTINKDRKIPLPMEEPTEVGTIVVQTKGAGPVEISFEEGTKYFGLLMNCAPIRTDLDMSIGGMDTFGESHTQDCPPYSFDPEPGTEITAGTGLGGFLGAAADRTVHLDWPEDAFELVEAPEGADAHTGVGSGSFTWTLRRKDTPLPEDATISAYVDSIGPGDPTVNAVSIGGVEIHPAAIGDIEHSEASPAKELHSIEPEVQFNRDPVVVGIGDARSSETPKYPVPQPPAKPDYPYQLKATLAAKHADLRDKITFASTDPNKATVEQVGNPEEQADKSWVFTLKVTGKAATEPDPKNPNIPDVKKQARAQAAYKGVVLKEVPVKVIRPNSQTHNVGNAQHANSAAGMPEGLVALWSAVNVDITFTFLDQFGNRLHQLYDGAKVDERFTNVKHNGVLPYEFVNPGHWVTVVLPPGDFLNNGVKRDAVGLGGPAGIIVQQNGQAHQDWLAGKPVFHPQLQRNITSAFEALPGKIDSLATLENRVDEIAVTPKFTRRVQVLNAAPPPVPLTVTDNQQK